jgi:hypothetical protein
VKACPPWPEGPHSVRHRVALPGRGAAESLLRWVPGHRVGSQPRSSRKATGVGRCSLRLGRVEAPAIAGRSHSVPSPGLVLPGWAAAGYPDQTGAGRASHQVVNLPHEQIDQPPHERTVAPGAHERLSTASARTAVHRFRANGSPPLLNERLSAASERTAVHRSRTTVLHRINLTQLPASQRGHHPPRSGPGDDPNRGWAANGFPDQTGAGRASHQVVNLPHE